MFNNLPPSGCCPHVFQLANQRFALPEYIDELVPPLRAHVRQDVEIKHQLREQQAHLVPGHIHAQTVPRPDGEGLKNLTNIVLVLGVA